MKAKVKFVCQNCGYESARWLGKGSECNSWNSFVEEKTVTEKSQKYTFEARKNSKVSAITDIEGRKQDKYNTGINELNKVLGGGLVIGSLVLIGGEPGIGKSTLVLQMCNELSKKYGSVLYISGEESISQIKMRANRLKAVSKDIFLVSETNIKVIEKHIYEAKPKVVIIDSIQTIFNEDIPSAPGSVSQVRENATKLMYISKGSGVSIFLVGHVTKDGSIAGPRVLEHLVDTVLYFEGDKNHNFRILRSYKNRFGPANEIAVFEMAEGAADASGSVIISAMEGTRPFLVEIQALVSPSYFGMPQRRASGVDYNRFTLLAAVLEKRGGFNLANQDIFVNVAGGVSVDEPAADLGVVVAIASSIRDIPTDAKTVCFGEVGLGGEIRAVSQVTERIKEAARLGFTKCIVPQSNMNGLVIKDKIQVQGARYIRDVLNTIF